MHSSPAGAHPVDMIYMHHCLLSFQYLMLIIVFDTTGSLQLIPIILRPLMMDILITHLLLLAVW